jgi:transposase
MAAKSVSHQISLSFLSFIYDLCTVIRLPPCHPDLNPIEKNWGIMKTRIPAKNVTFKLRDVQQLAEQNFAGVRACVRARVCVFW